MEWIPLVVCEGGFVESGAEVAFDPASFVGNNAVGVGEVFFPFFGYGERNC